MLAKGVNGPRKGEFVKTLVYLMMISVMPFGMTACGGCQATPEAKQPQQKKQDRHIITVSADQEPAKKPDTKDEQIRQLNQRITALQEKRDLLETKRQVQLNNGQRLQSRPGQNVDAQMYYRQADSIQETIDVMDRRIDELVRQRAVLEGKNPDEESKEYRRRCEEARKNRGKRSAS